MKKLGSVYVKTRSRLLVIKPTISNPERLVGAEVYDSDLKKIGLVIDIIGRVDNPYIVVKPDSIDTIDYIDVGSTLYYYVRRERYGKATRRRVSRKK